MSLVIQLHICNISSDISVFYSFTLVWFSWRYCTAHTVSPWILLSSRTDTRAGVPLPTWDYARPVQSCQSWCLPALPCWYGKDKPLFKSKKLQMCVRFDNDDFTLLIFPAGMFCSQPGLSQPTGLCEAGYYCQAGSTSPNSTQYQVLLLFSFVAALSNGGLPYYNK